MFEFVPSDGLVRELAEHRAWMFSRRRLDTTSKYVPRLLEPVSEGRIREAVKIRLGSLLGAIVARAERGGLSEVVLIEAGKFANGFERALHAELNLKGGRTGDALMFRIAREFYHDVKSKGGNILLSTLTEGPRILFIEGGSVVLRISNT